MQAPPMPATHARPRFRAQRRSPARTRIGALQVLHLGENVPEMFAVFAALAMPGMRAVLGAIERGLCEYLIDAQKPCRLNLRQPRCHALLGHGSVQIIFSEQFDGVGPESLQRRLHPRMAFFGAIAKAYQPARAVAQVIAD